MFNIRRPLVASLFLSMVLLPISPGWGWIDTGHKIVALVAWKELTPKTRDAVTKLLKQHPEYAKYFAASAPANATDEQLAQHVFATAATWPDLIRAVENPMHTLYSHPGWHYIDIPFVVDGQPVPQDSREGGPGPHNIVEALQKNTADLKNAATSPTDKAIAACWVMHLVGDIHQPLHAASMYSPKFPKGDQGGNGIMILRDPPYPDSRMKLHLLWDELPGQFKSDDFDGYEADGLHNDPRFSRQNLKDLLAVTDFMAWAKESYVLAVKYAYLDGKIVDGNSKDSNTAAAPSKAAGAGDRNTGTRSPIPGVPPGYIDASEEVVAKQLTLAGYRLADVLNSIFDPK